MSSADLLPEGEITTNNSLIQNLSTEEEVLTYNTLITTTPVDSLCESEESETDTSSSSCGNSTIDSTTQIVQFEAIGTWGTYGIDETAFCDKFRPTVRFEKYRDLELEEEEIEGCLTDRIIASCSSYLEKCPQIGKFVRCKTVLPKKGLKDIDVLKYHHFLQYLDLSWNKLRDVSILEHLPFLIHLDVSYNKIEDLLDFRPPYNLTFVNYSNNAIKYMKDLSDFWSIKSLNLSNNQISKIQGLQNLRYLETLDLSFNNIDLIENLDHLNIINLSLHHNKISNFICDNRKGFKTMPVLTYVRLGYNDLSGLNIFENSVFLQSIDLEENNIQSLVEVSHLQDMNLLLSVNFNKNPIKNCDHYEAVCIDTIKNLQYLDGLPIDEQKKIFAKQTFNHETKLHASQDHANILTLSHLTKLPYLGVNVIPFDSSPRPIIILVSPIGSRQDSLIKKFAKMHPQHVTRLISHTDKEMMECDDVNDYHFVSQKEFNKLLENGEFLMMYNVLNDSYGLSQEELSRGVQGCKVMIVSAELTAALAFRLRGFRPFLVLALPKSKQIHRHWLMETYDSRVYNIRYPEAAIKIFNRESQESSISSTEVSTTSSSTSRFYAHKRCSELSAERTLFDYGEECIMPEQFQQENEEYYEDVQRIYRKYKGMVNYCWPNPILEKLYGSENFTSESSEGQCLCEDQTRPLYNRYSYEILSCEGSTVNFPENLVQDFYSKVIDSREKYLDFHRQNPGVFYDVVFTDELDFSLLKLKHISKMAMRTQRQKSNFKTFNHVDICQNIIGSRMKIYEEDIERAMVRNVNCTK